MLDGQKVDENKQPCRDADHWWSGGNIDWHIPDGVTVCINVRQRTGVWDYDCLGEKSYQAEIVGQVYVTIKDGHAMSIDASAPVLSGGGCEK